jgi:hypothetical protein
MSPELFSGMPNRPRQWRAAVACEMVVEGMPKGAGMPDVVARRA